MKTNDTTDSRSHKKTSARGRRTPPPPPPGSGSSFRETSNGRKGNPQGRAEKLITVGILAAVLSILASLFLYFHPLSAGDILSAAENLRTRGAQYIAQLKEKDQPAETPAAYETGEAEAESSLLETEEEVLYMEHSSQLGDISDLGAEPVYPPQDDAVYSCMLDTSLGPLLYYNQGDIRWKEYLYGGSDRLAKYGCGPVCVSMLINSFTPTSVSPVEMADWSAANGYYAPQSGSYHGLIPGSLSAFGLQVDSVTERTPDNARQLLGTGHVLVALMGRGTLTQNGHFIIIAQLKSNGNVYIADPASYENSTREWDLDLLMGELKKSYDSGGPLWAVSLAPDGSGSGE